MRWFRKCFRINLTRRCQFISVLQSLHHQSHQVKFRWTWSRSPLKWEMSQVIHGHLFQQREIQGTGWGAVKAFDFTNMPFEGGNGAQGCDWLEQDTADGLVVGVDGIEGFEQVVIGVTPVVYFESELRSRIQIHKDYHTVVMSWFWFLFRHCDSEISAAEEGCT